jgi:hypothetical protein
MPVEREFKMDLRWQLHHVTATVVRAFGLTTTTAESQMWIFYGHPMSAPEEPLNAHASRTEATTLKEIQRSAMYIAAPSKKPLTFHAVELPFPSARTQDRGLVPFCIRFFDDSVREMGNAVVMVADSGTVGDILSEARKHIDPEWGITGQLRLLEVADSRLHKVYPVSAPIRSLLCYGRPNIFYHSLRAEADSESSAGSASLVEIYHTDRSSGQAFCQPFLLSLSPGERVAQLKARCKAKLRVPDGEFKSWRVVRSSRTAKAFLKDDEAWDSDPSPDAKICLEHSHPNPSASLARQSRYSKPLTIK